MVERPTLLKKLLFCYLKCEETGEVHSQFQALLSAINKPSTNFSLSIANRLYRAKGFHFLEKPLAKKDLDKKKEITPQNKNIDKIIKN
ncbi:hypothetical protein Y1Q_0011018 [Alligator mississippiensis]|uniref:Uncharacterized protein n=1 Tax=Alligator mississippiensis TaxID=8496 RepID=A0A151MZI8_ALLMI|nr:hypothetical protein Y1Q_0011018 [Alligator mississippiensis]